MTSNDSIVFQHPLHPRSSRRPLPRHLRCPAVGRLRVREGQAEPAQGRLREAAEEVLRQEAHGIEREEGELEQQLG